MHNMEPHFFILQWWKHLSWTRHGWVDRQSLGYITQCGMRPCTTQRITLIVIVWWGIDHYYQAHNNTSLRMNSSLSLSLFPHPLCDFQGPYASTFSHPICHVNNHDRTCCCKIFFVLITFAANAFSVLHARYYRLTVRWVCVCVCCIRLKMMHGCVLL